MSSKHHLKHLMEYPSLLVSGVAHGAVKEIEQLEEEIVVLRSQIEWLQKKLKEVKKTD